MTRVNSTSGYPRRNKETLRCRIIIVRAKSNVNTHDVTFNIQKCRKTLKNDVKLAFSNYSTNWCSKAAQGMHCLTK